MSGDSVPHACSGLVTRVRTCGSYCRGVPRPAKQAPPPLRVDILRVVLAGTALWIVALVVLLLLGDRVDQVWTWTCVAGIALGGVGLFVMRLQGQIGRRD